MGRNFVLHDLQLLKIWAGIPLFGLRSSFVCVTNSVTVLLENPSLST